MHEVALIGAGYWATKVARVISEHPGSRLRRVVDVDPARAQVLADRAGATAGRDLSEILDDDTVSAVYVATPPATHHAIARQALLAGKHVLVEKPLTTTSATAGELVRVAEQRDRVLMVGHTFLYSPPVQKVKQLLDGGDLGAVHYIDSQRVNLGRYQDSGVLWDLGPHDISILAYWLGELPCAVTATGRSFVAAGYEDVAFVTLEFPSGVVAQLHLSWLAPARLRRTTVAGSRRMVVYDDTAGPEAVKLFDLGVDRPHKGVGEPGVSYRSGDTLVPHLAATEPLAAQWAHFLACVADGSRPVSDGRTGLDVVGVLEATAQAMRSGRRVVIPQGQRVAA